MIGRVDAHGRALQQLELSRPNGSVAEIVEAWVDTGFTSHLMVPRHTITTLGLLLAQICTAILADGSTVQVETFIGQVDWFGQRKLVEIIAGDGAKALLGVGLLLGHQLHIDYAQMTMAIT